MSLNPHERPEGHADNAAAARGDAIAGSGPETTPSGRRPGELTAGELVRWGWRQLTSMRTALILLFLLALAAVPGSLVPQSDVDSLKVTRWQEAHPKLTPIYERLGLFSVYDTPWFSAIYILLMISLVGCILPRTRVYLRALRAEPPAAPRHLTRMPDHTTLTTAAAPEAVLARAERVLKKRRFRVRRDDDAVRAERGYLREAGNLLFHLAILVVLAGFAAGSMLGYRGGVIVLVGNGFANQLTQYDDFAPGSLFDEKNMEPFYFHVDSFDVDWLTSGPKKGMARNFSSNLTYQTSPDAPEQKYNLRVNHPLSIGGTDVFLIGHGYAPVITVKDPQGKVVYSGPTIFLPTDQTLRSFGVVKVPDGLKTGMGLEGEFYPTYAFTPESGPFSVYGDAKNPGLSMTIWTGDMGMDDGTPQSVYALDRDELSMVKKKDGAPARVDLMLGQTTQLPNGMGTVSFDKVERWNKVQISRTPGIWLALVGVCLALLGLLGSLFIRPRRAWVRVRRSPAGETLVEIAILDRAGGDEVADELAALAAQLEESDR